MYLSTTKFEGYKSKSIFGLPELYYMPQEIDFFGTKIETEPSITELIERYFITDGEDYYGYYTGLKSLNNIHGTTQVPATIEIKSNKVKEKSIYKQRYTRYIVYPASHEINEQNWIYLELLDDIEELYNYFEENIVKCIKVIVKELKLSKQIFDSLLDNYSARTNEVIDHVFEYKKTTLFLSNTKKKCKDTNRRYHITIFRT